MPTERVQAMIDEFSDGAAQGASVDETLAKLKKRGANAVEAIRVIQSVYSMDAKTAKVTLDSSPSWADIVCRSEPARDQLEEAARILAEE
jgi:hypothetical protein